MKTAEELKAFCAGYLEGALACNAELADWDDWVLWEGFDIQFHGTDYDGLAPHDKSLACSVYVAGYEELPDTPAHRFAVEGKTQ